MKDVEVRVTEWEYSRPKSASVSTFPVGEFYRGGDLAPEPTYKHLMVSDGAGEVLGVMLDRARARKLALGLLGLTEAEVEEVLVSIRRDLLELRSRGPMAAEDVAVLERALEKLDQRR